ncbi:MAG: phosphate transport system regulatory protein PhoU [Candidatus Dadabacteria bacterium]|nr:MAG: phosphate transport system regulatory protein PhoU [Candidatus Dadabacteria bacterium]
MSVHLTRALEALKKSLLNVAALAEEQVQKGVKALTEKDLELAEEVSRRDSELDQMEVELEEECLKILALHQPVAFDLRLVVAVLKINNDLERIGDLARNMAERCSTLIGLDASLYPFDYGPMADKTVDMLRLSIDSLIKQDVNLAHAVLEADRDVDDLHRKHYQDVKDSILANPDRAQVLIEFLSISRYLERVADLATNIAEDVIYLVDGKIVRHIY